MFLIVLAGLLLTVGSVHADESKVIDLAELPGAVLKLNVPITVPAAANSYAEEDTQLAATVILSKEAKEQALPTILITTAYRHEFLSVLAVAFLTSGYNVVCVDVRGTGSSADGWEMLDLIEQYDLAYLVDSWIPSQPWSDGRIGMYGPSYMGITQMQTAGLIEQDASGNPVHLKAIFPLVPMADAYRDVVGHGGNLDIEFILMWVSMTDMLALMPPSTLLGSGGLPDVADMQDSLDIWLEHLYQTPVMLSYIMDADHRLDSFWYDQKSPMIYWPQKPSGGWGFAEGSNILPRSLPAFIVGGWFDIFTNGTLNTYAYGLQDHKAADKALLIGEWYHLGGSFGMGLPCIDTGNLALRWFDWKIKGEGESFMGDFPVILRVMGEKRWRAEKAWPLPPSRTDNRTYYLSKVKPSAITGDSYSNSDDTSQYSLVSELTVADISGDDPVLKHSVYNLHGLTSRSAVRWLAGAPAIMSQASKLLMGQDVDYLMPWEDERMDEWDVPTFTTEELQDDLEIVGPLHLKFWARTEFTGQAASLWYVNWLINSMFGFDSNLLVECMQDRDVQWVAELTDVFPNGRARNVSSGWMRASHRPWSSRDEHLSDPAYDPFDPFYDKGDRNPAYINAGELYEYDLELWPTCNVFKAGHRIRLSLSGSDFPHLIPLLTPSENTILIDAEHPARLEFTSANTADENITWKWIGPAGNQLDPTLNTYLKEHVDESRELVAEEVGDGEAAGASALLWADDDDSRCFIAISH